MERGGQVTTRPRTLGAFDAGRASSKWGQFEALGPNTKTNGIVHARGPDRDGEGWCVVVGAHGVRVRGEAFTHRKGEGSGKGAAHRTREKVRVGTAQGGGTGVRVKRNGETYGNGAHTKSGGKVLAWHCTERG